MQRSSFGHTIPCLFLESLIMVSFAGLMACAASQPGTSSPIGKGLLGRSTQELSACAGDPLQKKETSEGVVLSYYKEASLLEESGSASKGSRSGVHHGCWAHLLMGGDRVVGVEFRSVPPSVNAIDHCEEIFHACFP